MSNPLKIIQLKAENIKRIKVVEINPDDNTVIISGENGQGKSSVIDCIGLVLDIAANGKNIVEPIRKGEDKAKIFTILRAIDPKDDFPDILVTRTFTHKNTYLKVEPKELAKQFGGAQSLLNTFIGRLAFDSLEFMGLKEKEQRDMLLNMVDIGIDLDAWEVKRKQVFDERTDVKRKVKEFQIKVDAVETDSIPNDTPDKEVNISSVINEYNVAKNTEEKRVQVKNRMYDIESEIVQLSNERTELENSVRLMPTYNLSGIQDRLNNSEQINKNVRLLQQYNLDSAELNIKNKNVETLTSHLDQMEQQKQDAIKAAKFPISGLGFSSSGVLFNGIPISQIATSEQIKVSMSIAMAFNPNLRVIIIKGGSLLDHKNLELVKQMVKDKDYQLWIERVDDTGKLGIVIEDGQVKTNKKISLDNVKDDMVFGSNPDDLKVPKLESKEDIENEKSKSDWSF